MKINVKTGSIIPKWHFSNLYNLLVKEFKLQFDSPAAYVVLFMFLLIEFIFVFIIGSFLILSRATLEVWFDLLPWLFMLVVPALTMGAFSKERADGTLEYVLSKPVGILELVLSKVLMPVVFANIIFVAILPIWILLSFYGSFDWGKVLTQYLGTMFLVMTFSSLGVLISSLQNSQIGAFLSSVVVNLLFLILGLEFITSSFPLNAGEFLSAFSFLTHYFAIARGVLDMRDILFFVSCSFLFVLFTYNILISNKYVGGGIKIFAANTLTIVSLIVFLTIGVFGRYIPGRIDLTQDKLYTLSNISRDIVASLDEEIEITFYVSAQLPSRYQIIKRDIEDMLSDYQLYANDNLTLRKKVVMDNDMEIIQELREKQIQPVEDSMVSTGAFQLKTTYMGLSIEKGEQVTSIPFVQSTNSLEYDISSRIKKLVTEDSEKKVIGFLEPGTNMNKASSEMKSVLEALESNFKVESVVVPTTDSGDEDSEEEKKEFSIPDNIDVLIIGGVNTKMEENVKEEILRYFQDGGALVHMVDTVNIDLAAGLNASINENSMRNLFEEYGVKVEPSVVYDTERFETLNFGNARLSYPYWIKSVSNRNHPSVNAISEITIPWGSWINVDTGKSDNVDIFKLIETSNSASFDSENFQLDPNNSLEFSETNLEKLTMAVAIAEKDDNPGRAVVVGDSDILSDNMIQANIQNGVFLLNSLEWLSGDTSLAQIRVKNRTPDTFEMSGQEIMWIQFGATGGVLGMVVLVGIGRMQLRRKKSRKSYSKNI